MSSDLKRTSGRPAITGKYHSEVVDQLEKISPRPRLPVGDARNEPGSVLQYIEAVALMHRNDLAYTHVTSQAELAEIKADVDEMKGHMIALEGRLGRVEERTAILNNSQVTQNERAVELEKKIDKVQETAEGALTGMHGRLNKVELRMDDYERRLQQLNELVLADIDVRRKEYDRDHEQPPPTLPSTGPKRKA